jgi:hypothetical protein
MWLCDVATVLLFQANLEAQESTKGCRTEVQRAAHCAGAKKSPVCCGAVD